MLKKAVLPFTIIFLFIITGLLIFLPDVHAEADFFLGLSGGVGYAPNKSMHNGVENYNDGHGNSGHVTSTAEGIYAIAFALEVDLRIYFNFVGLGLSYGHQYGPEAESCISYGYIPFVYEGPSYYRTLKLEADSLLGTLYFGLFNHYNHIVLLGAGAGKYYATMKYSEDYPQTDTGIDRRYKGNTIGYHAKIEYNFIWGYLNVFGGFMLRYVKIDEFKSNGETLILNGEKVEGSFTGFLFYAGVGVRI